MERYIKNCLGKLKSLLQENNSGPNYQTNKFVRTFSFNGYVSAQIQSITTTSNFEQRQTRSQSKFRTSKKRRHAIDILREQNKKQKIL